MKFSEYQQQAHDFAAYGDNDFYPFLLLAEEAGEVCGKIAKLIRNEGQHSLRGLTAEQKTALKKELGDVLWAASEAAGKIGLDLDDVALFNLCKLSDRRERGKICGEGDNR